jgi:hypothetical protein
MRNGENYVHPIDNQESVPLSVSTAPEISVEQLMQRIKEELARVGAHDAAHHSVFAISANANLDEVAASLSRLVSGVHPPTLVRLSLSEPQDASTPTEASAAREHSIHWKEIATYDGVAFIEAAYRAILGREADHDGLTCYGAMLRDGAPKVEILGRICDSAEAKQRNASLVGLTVRYSLDKAHRWPILGRLVSVVSALWNLPETERNYRRLSWELADRIDHREKQWVRVRAEIYDALRLLERTQNSLGDLTRLLASRNQVDAIQRAVINVIASIRAMQLPATKDANRTFREPDALESRVTSRTGSDGKPIVGV